MKCDQLRGRYDAVRSTRKVVEGYWNDVARYVTLFSPDFYRDEFDETSAEWDLNWLYSSVAANAHSTLSASIHGNLTSNSIKWFGLRFRQSAANEIVEGQQWLEQCSDIMYQALMESNFNMQINEGYQDITGYGTMALVEEEQENGKVNFMSVPLKNAWFEPDYEGKVLRFYQRYMWTADQILSKFDKRKVPKWIKEAAQASGSINKRFHVVYAVYKRNDNTADKPMAPKVRPYAYKYFLHDDATELEEGGYYEMPVFMPRWLTKSDSIWGYSPAMMAMPDIKTLNENIKLRLEAMSKDVNPPWGTTQRGVIGSLNFNSGKVNQFRSKDDVWPLNSGTNWGANTDEIQRLTYEVQKAFHIDQLELKESPAMTATEVNVRYELMQRILGPVLGRLQSELLDPLIQRTFMILFRAGRLPEMPESVKQLAPEMDVEYLGPLARAQKMDEAVAIERYLASVGQAAQLDPQVMDNIDMDHAAKLLNDAYGAPASILRTEKKVESIRAERAEKQKAMAEAEQMKVAGEGLKATGEGMQAMEGVQGDAAKMMGGQGG